MLILSLTSCQKTEVLYDNVKKSEIIERDNEATGFFNPDREIHGVWIASVGNINYPSRKGLSEKELKKELLAIVDNCERLNINSIFFQVRPTADALYRSELFPASEFVSGKQGKEADGGFDSLEYLIYVAHSKNISVHAWVNPLRITYGSAKYPKTDLSALCDGHVARENPEWVIAYDDGKLYFDAGNPSVRDYIARGVSEIVKNYSVDGIIFDDYFYPYPVKTEDGIIAEFDDQSTYLKYGGTLSLEDWRRENINSLIEECYNAVKSENKLCQFGVSPFGIWQNGDGSDSGSRTAGLEAYHSLYCDALAWARGGYVDYISPQLYWSFDTGVAPYGELSRWWSEAIEDTDTKLIISHAAYMYASWDSPEGEMTEQIAFSKKAQNYRGSIMFGYADIANNTSGVADEIAQAFNKEIIYSN